MNRFAWSCALSALVISCPAFAEQVAESTPTLVVTATRTPVPEDQVLAAMIVIDQEQVERAQVTDVAELLRFEAGLDLGRTGGPGAQTSIFTRGGESNHTLVLIDGVRVNPATSGGAALQHISPHMIERIEVVRGPRSTLYGSDAIAGVINVITRQPREPQANVFTRLGGNNTRDVGANFGFADDEKGLSLGVSQARTDGIEARVGDTFDSGYENTTIHGRGHVRIGDEVTARLRFWNANGTVGYSGFGNVELDQDFQNQTAALTVDLQAHRHWLSSLTVSRGEDDLRQNQANFLGQFDEIQTVRPAIDWHNIVNIGQANRFSFGAGAQREDVEALSFGSVIEEERDIFSAFMQNETHLGRHHLLLAVNYSDYEGFDEQVNGNFEYGFDLFAGTRLVASAATGFRAPDATDRFGFGGNPDLEPEEAENFELGLRQSLGAYQIVDLRAFYSEVEDLISVEFDPGTGSFVAVNVDKYRNRGVELSWQLDSANWHARLSGILQEPEDATDNTQLLRRAEKSITAAIQRSLGPAWLGIDVLGADKRPDFGTTLGGYALVNLGAGIKLNSKFAIHGRVENLLDKDYRTAAGFNQPGAVGYITLSYGI